MKDLELTDVERVILANQYEILSILKEDDSYDLLARNLRDGHKWIYSQVFDWISPNLAESKVDIVLKTLNLYSTLQSSYAELQDKSDIDAKELNFPGFDGNNESEFLSFANALLKDHRYEHVLGPSVKNSHMPSIDIYRRMIEEWQNLGETDFPLSKDQIRKVLDARIHPSNRSGR
jgi:uncharacterized protein